MKMDGLKNSKKIAAISNERLRRGAVVGDVVEVVGDVVEVAMWALEVVSDVLSWGLPPGLVT